MWPSYQQNVSSTYLSMPETEQKANLTQIYQTPIKQPQIVQNYNVSSSPYQFDFNLYFGNLFSSGHIPFPYESVSSTAQQNRENNFFHFRSSLEKSGYKITPGSEYKISNSVKNSSQKNENNDNANVIAKKNLSQIFDKAKNENFCSSKSKNENSCSDENQFLFGSPPQKSKNKKLFECSGSTLFNSTSVKSSQKKKRRFRKNNEQLKCLSHFYSENKHWSKNQIKKISEETGLKENKVYKWLWDQKNKEYKSAKFVINKK